MIQPLPKVTPHLKQTPSQDICQLKRCLETDSIRNVLNNQSFSCKRMWNRTTKFNNNIKICIYWHLGDMSNIVLS